MSGLVLALMLAAFDAQCLAPLVPQQLHRVDGLILSIPLSFIGWDLSVERNFSISAFWSRVGPYPG